MNIQSNWLRYGIIYALASICLMIFTYYIYPSGLMWQTLIHFILLITIMVMAAKAEKVEQKGILSYGEAFKITSLTSLTGLVISGLFGVLLVNFIDPSLVDVLKDMSMQVAESMLKMFGMPEDQMSEALEKAEEEAENQFTTSAQLFNIVKSSVFFVVIAAIVSLFVKKNENIDDVRIEDLGRK